jgi:hypothetical protein
MTKVILPDLGGGYTFTSVFMVIGFIGAGLFLSRPFILTFKRVSFLSEALYLQRFFMPVLYPICKKDDEGHLVGFGWRVYFYISLQGTVSLFSG